MVQVPIRLMTVPRAMVDQVQRRTVRLMTVRKVMVHHRVKKEMGQLPLEISECSDSFELE